MTNFAPTTFTVNNLAPASTTSINGTSDNIISFDLVFNAGHTITTLQVFGIEAGGEKARATFKFVNTRMDHVDASVVDRKGCDF